MDEAPVEMRNLCNSLTMQGLVHPLAASTFELSILIPSWLMTFPKNVTTAGWNSHFAFLGIQLMLSQLRQDPLNMFNMELIWRRIYQNVVYINNDKFSQNFPHHVVYQTLNNWWSVGQSIQHYPVLVVSCGHAKGRLPFVPSPDTNLASVSCSKVACTCGKGHGYLTVR